MQQIQHTNNFIMIQTQLKKMMLSTAIALTTGFFATAQTYPYTVNFEAADTSSSAPAKSYADTTSIDLNGATWSMPGVFLGTMAANDKYNGAHAARMRLTANSTGDPSSMVMTSNLPNGIGTVSFNAANYGTETGGTLEVFYSTNNGTSWTSVGTTSTLSDALAPFSFTVNQSGGVRIKLQKVETSNNRINIDDIVMTNYGTTTNLTVSSKSPMGTNVPLSTNQITITFNENIAAGSGNITLQKTGGSPQSFSVSSATISGMTATINGISLENASEYTVTVPASGFHNIANTLNSPNTTWTFTTEDTTTPAIPVYTSINETFTTCDNNTNIGMFKRYSVTGDVKKWSCSSYGHNDSNAVYINAGSAAGVSEASNDWLISNGLIDLSAMSNPQLSLWQKRRFSGNVTREIKISTNYVLGSDPTIATWTTAYTFSGDPDTTWTQVQNINLAPYKATPFYMAFTYSCDTTGAYELTYDDIQTSNTTAIGSIKNNNIGAQVLGDASRTQILLDVNLIQNAKTTISIFDMQGRKVAINNYNLHLGNNKVELKNMNLNAGMYIIHISNGTDYTAVKAVVR